MKLFLPCIANKSIAEMVTISIINALGKTNAIAFAAKFKMN